MAVDPTSKKTIAAAITEMTNRTPNDFRNLLADFAQTVATQQTAAPRILDPPTAPNIEVSEQRFDPQPLTLGNLNSAGGGDTGLLPTPTGSATRLGWQVITRLISGVWKWGVIKGVLINTQKNGGAALTVTGCLTDPNDPADAGWSAIGVAPQTIWLEVAFGTWPALASDPYINTTDYDGGELEYAFDASTPPNAIQTFARFDLGSVPSYDANGVPVLVSGGYGTLKLKNDGDYAFDALGINSNPEACPIIYIKAGGGL